MSYYETCHKQFLNRPLIFIAIFYILGIVISSFLNISYVFIVLFLIFIMALYLFKKLPNLIFWLTLSFFISILLCNIQTKTFPLDHIKYQVEKYKGRKVFVVGILVKDVKIVKENKTAELILKLEKVISSKAEEKVSGLVKLVLYNEINYEELNYGDRLKIRTRINFPKESKNPGEFNYKKYLERKKIFALGSIKPAEGDVIEKIGEGTKNLFISSAVLLKHKMLKIIEDSFPKDSLQSALLQGVLIGEEDALPSGIQREFRDTGTFHILAVSGFNVGLVVVTFFFILKLFKLPKKICEGSSIVFVILFCFISGASPSVTRATIIAVIILMALILERDTDILNILGFSALIVLIFFPFDLFDIGFQLSYVATFGIIYLTPKFEKILHFLPRLLVDIISVTFSAQIFVLPVLAFYFYYISIISFFANLLIAPFVWLSTVLGFIQVCFGFFSLFLAKVIGFINFFSLTFMLKIVKFFSEFSFSIIRMEPPTFFTILIYYVVIVLIFNFKSIIGKYPKYLLISVFILNVVIWPNIFFNKEKVEISFLSLKNAKVKILNYKNRFNLIYCLGKSSDYEVERMVLPSLYKNGINKINYLLYSSDWEEFLTKIKFDKKLKMNEKKDFYSTGTSFGRLNIKVDNNFNIFISNDAVTGVYKDEIFSLQKDKIVYGREEKKTLWKDVRDSNAKIIYSYGHGWFEKKY
ncbi:MAG: ComEC/Rec2 family competence protein [Candidatus Firestonebacteria bacterium]